MPRKSWQTNLKRYQEPNPSQKPEVMYELIDRNGTHWTICQPGVAYGATEPLFPPFERWYKKMRSR